MARMEPGSDDRQIGDGREQRLDVAVLGVERAFGRALQERMGLLRLRGRVRPLGANAIQAFDGYQVLVVDADRCRSDGMGWLDVVRDRPSGVGCVVMVTDPSRVQLLSFIRAGVNDVVPKPVDPSELARVVRRVARGRGGESTTTARAAGGAVVAVAGGTMSPRARATNPNEELQRVNETLRAHVSQLTILYQLGRDISEDENWSDALDRFLMALVNYTQADGAALLLFSEEGRRLGVRSNFQVDPVVLRQACDTLLRHWKENPRGTEIHALESYGDVMVTSCLERRRPWRHTLLPLRYRARELGFVLVDKAYRDGIGFKADYHFFNTLETIMAEEVANASYISELRQLWRFNRKVLDNISSGVVTTDLEGRIQYFNAHAAEMCSQLRESAGLELNRLFKSHELRGGLYRWIMDGEPDTRVLEIECDGGDRSFPVRLRIARMHDDNLNGTVILGIFEDLTDQRRLEAEVRRHDRLRVLGQVSAGVAHEIRNPLTGIATSAEVLAGKIKGDSEKEKYTRAIIDEIHRLDGIIRDLLQFARPPKPQMAPCRLRQVVDRVVDLVSDRAGRKQVAVSCAGSVVDPVVEVDRNQLTQVMLNLLLNAIDACQEKGRVVIDLRMEARGVGQRAMVCADVIDDGAGVPDEVRDRLFEPFVTTKTNGTGLGLAISQQIVEEHRGQIECAFLDGGTRFTIRLPILDPETPQAS